MVLVIDFIELDLVCMEELDCELVVIYLFIVMESCLMDQLMFIFELDVFVDGMIDVDFSD